MPAIPTLGAFLESTLVQRETLASPENSTAIASQKALEVICAWPVSGQYGPGTRALYYILIAACVVARKVEWIRNACLAAVLLFPAIAALHAIVLAVLHVEGAVDMDIYGAFQLCAIGILTAPATVRLSQTYFNNPGRNIIFIWTVLLLAGLLSLIVEFMRLEGIAVPRSSVACMAWAGAGGKGSFPYGDSCDLKCSPDDGPTSSLREGSTDNIYVVPTPDKLSFNTTTLLAAACCIPAILSLVSMWIKIMDHNWEKLSDGSRKHQEPDGTIKGTNGATVSEMKKIGETIKDLMSLIEVPVMAAAVLAILIKGEMNFWSRQVYYQTEPITSIGQWAPIVGSGLAVLGSLYLLVAAEMDAAGKGEQQKQCKECARSETTTSSRRQSGTSTEDQELESQTPIHQTPTLGNEPLARQPTALSLKDKGGRRKVAHILNWASENIAIRTHSQYEKGGFKRDHRSTYPETPGEHYKNYKLPEDKLRYGESRAPSCVSSRASIDNGEGSSRSARSPTRHESHPISSPSPARSRSRHNRDYSRSFPTDGRLHTSSYCPNPEGLSQEWPQNLRPFSGVSSRSRANSSSEVAVSPTTMLPPNQNYPTIIVSSAGAE
ncbi:unnamed protein product [Penicillium salamii]|uniref:Uncharacterized protein n=1 Tax=Penicillium salamii TaxID=1612424 RepID=A0A9W4K2I4_9EURO|nr:unnamed protein product [Penicillium salamii]CAG7955817.1 unnamed protein product [Penicillium salamii]CAG8189135.1 unnamed protein product [Penicillium salamii]CAG8192443.1 unnamed protein product [Penicillium salamii]CAG8226336.1 unnamed protein product [Penicillium salamii]